MLATKKKLNKKTLQTILNVNILFDPSNVKVIEKKCTFTLSELDSII